MKIKFTQIYSEVGVSYCIPTNVLISLARGLNDLDRTIEHYAKKFNTIDYLLSIYISATLDKDRKILSRPIVLSKRKTVEFCIQIQYKEIKDFILCMDYVLGYVEIGMIGIFEKYKINTDKVRDVFLRTNEDIRNKTLYYKDEYDKCLSRKSRAE